MSGTWGVDPLQVAAIVRDVAASEIMPRFRHLAVSQIYEKLPGQVVTEADLAAERQLQKRLCDLLPGSACIGEESVFSAPALLDALDRSGPVWVIDPVDGTANFARGHPRFAVILALVIDGHTRIGWIFDPVAGRMTIAEHGGGTWCDGRRLAVSAGVPLSQMRGSSPRNAQLSRQVAAIGRQGSAAHDYLDLVGAQLEFACFRRLMPWDHAAGVLMHAEAGGWGRLIDGTPYRPGRRDGVLLLAGDDTGWQSLRPLLAPPRG